MDSNAADMLINRVRKNRRMLKAWLRREEPTCYRLYDRDIPELPLAIDWYDGHLHASVYERKRPLPFNEAQAMLEALGEALGVAKSDCFMKSRARQRGADQYRSFGDAARTAVVEEGGSRFEVNLSDSLDTGLFLDHRPARQWVRQAAAGMRVLNLFCYTGAFTVHAAAGGATETVSVDLSKAYLAWAERNLALNGVDVGIDHQLIRADVMAYLEAAPRAYFDIVVLDPPTFSNSKAMDGTLDIQRDHLALLSGVWRCLKPGGQLYFSTNNRRFKLAEQVEQSWRIEDLSEASIPPDFRDRRVHALWRMEKP